MSITTTTYVRKPLYVEAVRVTPENFNEVAESYNGQIIKITERDKEFMVIKVPVDNPMNERQTQARIGDWILSSDRGLKVFSPKSFGKQFALVPKATPAAVTPAEVVADVKLAEKQGLNPPTEIVEPIAAVGTGPMPKQGEPGDVEVPVRAPAVPDNLEDRDPNVVHPPSTPLVNEENIVYPQNSAGPTIKTLPSMNPIPETSTEPPTREQTEQWAKLNAAVEEDDGPAMIHSDQTSHSGDAMNDGAEGVSMSAVDESETEKLSKKTEENDEELTASPEN